MDGMRTAPAVPADAVLAALRRGLPPEVAPAISEAQLAQAVRQLLDGAAAPRGHCLAVYGAKGGVGTSTVALALAWALAHRAPPANATPGASGGRERADAADGVAYADFTTAGAGVRGMLEVAPSYDLGDVAARADRVDGAYLQSVLLPHPDGVALLAGPAAPAEAPPLTVASAARVLGLLRDAYGHVVVDTDHHLADATLAALDAASRILLVTQLDVPALRGTQQALALFARLGYPEDKVLLVCNRVGSRARLTQGDAERVLGRRIAALLPNEHDRCAAALVTGQFLQRGGRHHPLAAAIERLAAQVAPPAAGGTAAVAPAERPRSRLTRLLYRP